MRPFLVLLALATISSACAPSERCRGDACAEGEDEAADAGVSDDAGDASDAGATDGGPDAGTLPNPPCRKLAKFPGSVPVGIYRGTGDEAPPNDFTMGALLSDADAPFTWLRFEVWHGFGPGGQVTLPAQRSLSPETTKLQTCDVCATYGEGCEGGACRTLFFAQAGSLSVTRADRDANQGRFVASGSNVKFVEWRVSGSEDGPVPGGKCVEIADVRVEVSWGISGACGGDPCDRGAAAGGCCSDAPYCTSSDHSSTRTYCSASCGSGGDGCRGSDNCCAGFKCFLGACMLDTCAGKSCNYGAARGGCCDAAPYCTGSAGGEKGCRSVCGERGATCGGTPDCCTGLTCTNGSCQ